MTLIILILRRIRPQSTISHFPQHKTPRFSRRKKPSPLHPNLLWEWRNLSDCPIHSLPVCLWAPLRLWSTNLHPPSPHHNFRSFPLFSGCPPLSLHHQKHLEIRWVFVSSPPTPTIPRPSLFCYFSVGSICYIDSTPSPRRRLGPAGRMGVGEGKPFSCPDSAEYTSWPFSDLLFPRSVTYCSLVVTLFFFLLFPLLPSSFAPQTVFKS